MSDNKPPTAGTRGPSRAVLATAVAASLVLGLAGVIGLASWIVGQPTISAVEMNRTSRDHAAPDGYRVWGVNDDGQPIRWDPCSPIELAIAPGVPAGLLDDLHEVVALVGEVTGLSLVVTGTTDERPSADRLPFQPERYGQRWAPVLVAWSSPRESDLPLRDSDRGVAIPVAVGDAGQRTYVTGQIVFNRERDDLRPGFADRSDSWGATVLHELAHLLGLGHVDEPGELMAEFPGSGPVEFGPGDRRGLAAVGADGGCVSVPVPRPVEFVRP